MVPSWVIFCGVFVTVFVFLKTLFYSAFLVNLGLVILAGYLTDNIVQLLLTTLPKQYLNDLDQKAVVITGCDTGFGNKIAQRLDSMGLKVYAGCLSSTGAGANSLKDRCSDSLEILELDVTKDDHVEKAVAKVRKTIGDKKLWALINNAGVGSYTEVEWCSLDSYRQIYEVNALGSVRVTKAFLPLLRDSNGRVVLVSSYAGRIALPAASAYSMSKSAVIAFADSLRREMLKWGISVHTIEPSLYRTPISEENRLTQSLKQHWDTCPKHIKECYGVEYFEEFKGLLHKLLQRSKPISKIGEVIEDMIDATVGMSPKLRYVPSIDSALRLKLVGSLPVAAQDYLFTRSLPQTPPAAAKPDRELKNPYFQSFGERQRKTLRRIMSLPVYEKQPLTPPKSETKFKFDSLDVTKEE